MTGQVEGRDVVGGFGMTGQTVRFVITAIAAAGAIKAGIEPVYALSLSKGADAVPAARSWFDTLTTRSLFRPALQR
jgi:hypothetical protein